MTDQSLTGAHSEQTIDALNDEEIRRWAKELGVTNVALLDAVEKVGPRVEDVRRHLDQALAGGQSSG